MSRIVSPYTPTALAPPYLNLRRAAVPQMHPQILVDSKTVPAAIVDTCGGHSRKKSKTIWASSARGSAASVPLLAKASIPGTHFQEVRLPNVAATTLVGYGEEGAKNDDGFVINLKVGDAIWDVVWDGIGSGGFGKELAEIFSQALLKLDGSSTPINPRAAITNLRQTLRESEFFKERIRAGGILPGAALTLVAHTKNDDHYEVECLSVGDVEAFALSGDTKLVLGSSGNHPITPDFTDPNGNVLYDAIGASHYMHDPNPKYAKWKLESGSYLVIGSDGLFNQFPTIEPEPNGGSMVQALHFHGATQPSEIADALLNEAYLRMQLAELNSQRIVKMTPEMYRLLYPDIFHVEPDLSKKWCYSGELLMPWNVTEEDGKKYWLGNFVLNTELHPIARFQPDNLTVVVRQLV